MQSPRWYSTKWLLTEWFLIKWCRRLYENSTKWCNHLDDIQQNNCWLFHCQLNDFWLNDAVNFMEIELKYVFLRRWYATKQLLTIWVLSKLILTELCSRLYENLIKWCSGLDDILLNDSWLFNFLTKWCSRHCENLT